MIRLDQHAQLSARVGRVQEAIAALQLALEIEACSSSTRGRLLGLLHAAERSREHFEVARQGVLQCPELPTALNDMAWLSVA